MLGMLMLILTRRAQNSNDFCEGLESRFRHLLKGMPVPAGAFLWLQILRLLSLNHSLQM